MTTTRTRNAELDAAIHELSQIKAPTKRAAFIAQTIISLETAAQVNEFTRYLRIKAGVHDISMLPDTTWTVQKVGTRRTTNVTGTAALVEAVSCYDEVSISWPSVYMHWGVMVSFGDFVAHSADYALTETYLSS